MPFLTEELWYAVYEGKPPAKSIALTNYPTAEPISMDSKAQSQMSLLQDLVRGIREFRKDLGVPEKLSVPSYVLATPSYVTGGPDDLIVQNKGWLERLSTTTIVETTNRNEPVLQILSWRHIGSTEIAINYNKPIDVAAERERSTKDIAKFEKIIASSDRQLNNPGFLAKAPAHIVEGLKKQRDEAKRLLDKARGGLDGLPEG
jgi:valyl-tRNA synthetase